MRLYTFRLRGPEAADQQAVATALLRLFAPQLLFYGLAALLGAVLIARRRLLAPMATPILNNLVVIGVLLAAPHAVRSLTLATARHSPGAIALLGLGTTTGVALQAVALLPALRVARCRVHPVWHPGHEAVRKVLRLSGWTFGYVVANQATLWVVLVLANAGAGDVSAYQAAYMFFLLPFAVVAVTVMTALLPELSTRWARGDVEGYRTGVISGLRDIAFWLLPAAAGYAILARPILTVALAHGALTTPLALRTADVLTLFAVGLPSFGLFLFLVSAFQAMQNTRTAFLVACVQNGVNVALALVLHPLVGVRGLALAFALSYVAGAACARRALEARIGGPFLLARLAARSIFATAAMALCVAGTSFVVGGTTGVRSTVQVTVGIAVGVSSYLLAVRRRGGGQRSPAGEDALPGLNTPRRFTPGRWLR
jgi:putative peptidoglycan lipid II flippase